MPFPSLYQSHTHTEVPACARINLYILGLVDMLSNASVCSHAILSMHLSVDSTNRDK